MFKWLFKSLLEEHVNELVDKRFKERVYERYWEQRQSQMEERIRRVKESLGTSSHGVDAKRRNEYKSPVVYWRYPDQKNPGYNRRLLK